MMVSWSAAQVQIGFTSEEEERNFATSILVFSCFLEVKLGKKRLVYEDAHKPPHALHLPI
jgi:hypothetical protein